MDLIRLIEASDRVIVSVKLEGDNIRVFNVELRKRSQPIMRINPGTNTLMGVLRYLQEIAERHSVGIDVSQWKRTTTMADDGVYLYFTLVYSLHTRPFETQIDLLDLVRESRNYSATMIDNPVFEE